MSKTCQRCGGSGDRFRMEKDGHTVLVKFGTERDAYLANGYKDVGENTCHNCGGYGRVDS